jgi:hypothetical protein
MKDTRKTPKVASKPENTTVTPLTAITLVSSGTPVELENSRNSFSQDKPGPGDYPFVEKLTETEFSLIAALRQSLQCEESWKDRDEREAWAFIQSMTDCIQNGDRPGVLTKLCDEWQFPCLMAAGVACAEAIRQLSDGWERSRKTGNPD